MNEGEERRDYVETKTKTKQNMSFQVCTEDENTKWRTHKKQKKETRWLIVVVVVGRRGSGWVTVVAGWRRMWWWGEQETRTKKR